MAKTTRQTSIFGAEDWKRIYRTYKEADFQSYDYETIISRVDEETAWLDNNPNEESTVYIDRQKQTEEIFMPIMKKLQSNTPPGGMPDMSNMDGMPDMSNMGGMPDMSNMGGMPDMSNMDGMPSSDDID